MMEYKGYTGQITSVDETNGVIHGHVVGIGDVITFEGKTSKELIRAFRDSIEDYLEFCASRKEPPEKPSSGRFLVRVSPTLHQRASQAARKAKLSLNAWVARAVQERLKSRR
jgi:predicted HicB family RNase H-like nuclease